MAALKLRKPDGGLVVLTERGRLLEQAYKGAGYTLVDSHWVEPDCLSDYRSAVTQYLLDHRYSGAEVTSWTVAVSYGPSGGFYHFNTHGIRRICLGRLALTFMPVEIDDLVEMAVRP